MEGSNVGFDHNGTDFFEHFGADFLNTGTQNSIAALNGIDDTFTASTIFAFSTGDCNYNVDQLAAGEGTVMLTSQDEIGRNVLYDAGNYRTIISSPILGAYHETDRFNSRSYLMMEYISFLVDIEGPELYISQSTLAFEEVYPGEDIDVSFMIQNIGYMDLDVWNINLEGNEFLHYLETPLTLAPQEYIEIEVTFRSFEPGIFSGYLEFESNDRDNELALVTLSGECLAAPDIDFADALSYELTEGEQGELSAQISNTGLGELTFEIAEDIEWLEISPASATVGANEVMELSFMFDAVDLTEGLYEDQIFISSNDPSNSLIIIDISFHILPIVDTDIGGIPKITAFNSVYPNPFNPQTTFSYDLAKQEQVVLEIYNLKGQKVETLINEAQQAGKHQLVWIADSVPSAIYFYRFITRDVSTTGKVVLMK